MTICNACHGTGTIHETYEPTNGFGAPMGDVEHHSYACPFCAEEPLDSDDETSAGELALRIQGLTSDTDYMLPSWLLA